MAIPFDGSRSPRSPRGFTLIEIVVVLFILGVVIAMAAAVTTALTASQKLSTTTTRMAAIDNAIVQFVMQQKRLPCPADGALASTDGNAGIEASRNASGCIVVGNKSEARGVVPWRTLGLSESDATDGWNRRMTYRVRPDLAADVALDMSNCDPAAPVPPSPWNTYVASCASCPGPDVSACTPPVAFLNSRGLEVRDKSNAKIMNPLGDPVNSLPPTGAAYVVISHGATGGGAYMSSGALFSYDGDGTQEGVNHADRPYIAPTLPRPTVEVTYYVDDSISEVSDTGHFDDILSHPSLLNVINKAGIGPRSHVGS